MSKHLVPGLAVLFLLIPSAGRAQTPGIVHQPVACAAADKFPRLEARFEPAASVGTARVVFQGQSPEWYSVVMKTEGAAFVGVLPKPMKSLKSFHYYVEVTDTALATNRTADYTVSVVESSSACKGKLLAAALASASVVLQGPAGVVALPVGFASTGVVVAGSAAGSSAGAAAAAAGAGGGMSTGAVVGIVGAVVAGAGVAVATHKGSENDGTYTAYTISVSVTGPTKPFPGDWGGALDVCVSGKFQGNPCSNTISVGSTGQIAGTAVFGTPYTVAVPANTNTSKYCGVVSGGSGAFGPSLPTVVVGCSW